MSTTTIENYSIRDGKGDQISHETDFRKAVKRARFLANHTGLPVFLYKQTITLQLQSQIYPES